MIIVILTIISLASSTRRASDGRTLAGLTQRNVRFRDRTRGQTPLGQRARPVLHRIESGGHRCPLEHAVARVQ